MLVTAVTLKEVTASYTIDEDIKVGCRRVEVQQNG
jgi:hypothetical protein